MKKKYFIRGFGIGVLFAAIIFGISYGMHNTDEKVIERARELGMVKEKEQDEDTLDLSTAAPKEGADASAVPEETDHPKGEDTSKEGGTSNKEDVSNKEDAPDKADTPAESAQPTPVREVVIEKTPKPSGQDKNDSNGKTKIVVEITSGMWSDTVALQLAEAGLVDDADAFDKFLNQNGYASKIKTGSYQIAPGLTYKEIAKVISGQ